MLKTMVGMLGAGITGGVIAAFILKKKEVVGLWSTNPRRPDVMTAGEDWNDINFMYIDFNLDDDAAVYFSYTIGLMPEAYPGNSWVGVRLLVDNETYRQAQTVYKPQPYQIEKTTYKGEEITNTPAISLSGQLLLNLPKGMHNAKLQWKNISTVNWIANPYVGAEYNTGRILTAIAFYKKADIKYHELPEEGGKA